MEILIIENFVSTIPSFVFHLSATLDSVFIFRCLELMPQPLNGETLLRVMQQWFGVRNRTYICYNYSPSSQRSPDFNFVLHSSDRVTSDKGTKLWAIKSRQNEDISTLSDQISRNTRSSHPFLLRCSMRLQTLAPKPELVCCQNFFWQRFSTRRKIIYFSRSVFSLIILLPESCLISREKTKRKRITIEIIFPNILCFESSTYDPIKTFSG